jgi:hypothetical protein
MGQSQRRGGIGRLGNTQKKGRLSAAGRKAISEATKRRWALKRADTEKGRAVAVKRASTKRGPMKVAKKAGASTKG